MPDPAAMPLPTPSEALRLRRDSSLAALLRQEIEAMIERGEMGPGEWVNEALLAGRFGVSRGPVREACRGLEQSGLLELIPNRGAFVRRVDATEAAELYDLRAALFALAGRTLAPRLCASGSARLRALLREMDAAAAAADLDRYYSGNLAFHAALLELAGNRRLARAYESHVRELHLFRRRALVSARRMGASNAEHAAILDALEARDAEGASALMARHVLDAKQRVLGAPAPADPPPPDP